MGELIRYQMYCLTEQMGVVTDYRAEPPISCPNNNEHIIDESTIQIYHKISAKTVKINQNSGIETGGYYRADQYEIEIPEKQGEDIVYDLKYPYNVSVHSVQFLITPENIGDRYEILSYPDTTIGYITEDLNKGNNYLTTNSTLGLNTGFRISITNNENLTENLGEITHIDQKNNKIWFSKFSTENFKIGSLLKITIPRITNGKFINTQNIMLGSSLFSGSGLEAEKLVRFVYKNLSGTSKTLNFIVELQY